MNRMKHSPFVVGVALVLLLLSMSLGAAAAQVGTDAWVSTVGGWAAVDGAYVNSDVTNSNTNAYAAVAQEGSVLTYSWTATFKETTFSMGPAAGMHILADSNTDVQRGNSYLVFQDSEFIRLYKAGGGALLKTGDFSVGARVGDTFAYRVEFNTETGHMSIFRDDKLVGEWQDPMPLKSGKYISLRTNASIAAFTHISVEAK